MVESKDLCVFWEALSFKLKKSEVSLSKNAFEKKLMKAKASY